MKLKKVLLIFFIVIGLILIFGMKGANAIYAGSCNHHWVYKRTVSPTCTTAGYTVQQCSLCHTEQKTYNIGGAKGHNLQRTVHNPTCTTGGWINYKCSRCGYGYSNSGSPATRTLLFI